MTIVHSYVPGPYTYRSQHQTMLIFSILRLLASILCISYVRAFATQTANTPHLNTKQHTTISFTEVSIEDGKGINSDDHQTTTTIGERIKCGESLIQLENLATTDECKLLVNNCIQYSNNITYTRQLDKHGLVTNVNNTNIIQKPCCLVDMLHHSGVATS